MRRRDRWVPRGCWGGGDSNKSGLRCWRSRKSHLRSGLFSELYRVDPPCTGYDVVHYLWKLVARRKSFRSQVVRRSLVTRAGSLIDDSEERGTVSSPRVGF
ncbi:hypothetical protein M0R45_000386 [Rubus argutus]|uniref:Uncharacterized protein n=1 Tax=Rubus argutus TaxID=59490 RepID=A0AAW1VPB6_RUBAR